MKVLFDMQIRDTIDLPEKFAEIPRDVLTFGPSPIQLLPRMSKDLGIKVHAKFDFETSSTTAD